MKIKKLNLKFTDSIKQWKEDMNEHWDEYKNYHQPKPASKFSDNEVWQLLHENTELKYELMMLKSKLNGIKRILE